MIHDWRNWQITYRIGHGKSKHEVWLKKCLSDWFKSQNSTVNIDEDVRRWAH